MSYYAKMGSGQKSLRLQVLQCLPIQTSSNWSIAFATISGSSVRMPASKLRVPSAFMPMPAPVRLALPIYASLPSKIIILKCALGQSTLSSPSYRIGNLSKSSLKFGPGSFACISLTATPFFISLANTSKKGFFDFPSSIYKSLISAVPIHKECFTCKTCEALFVVGGVEDEGEHSQFLL